MNENHAQHGPGEGVDDVVLFISRAVDGVATPAQWASFEATARAHPGLWRELACAQRDHASLVREVADATACAEDVELHSQQLHDDESADDYLVASTGFAGRFASVRSWGGWAAAAVLLIALVAQGTRLAGSSVPTTTGSPAGGTITAGPNFGSANDALDAYLAKGRRDGRVLGEVPDKIIVDSRPAEGGGGMEVIYVRQIVERARLKDLYRISHDEAGRPTPIPAHEAMRYLEMASRRNGAL
jgi:hypothetical protein